MNVQDVIEGLTDLEDDGVFKLLDAVSEEVKRRNGLLGPSVSDVRSNTAEKNVGLMLEALASIGKASRPPT